MISADVKANIIKTTRNKRSGGCCILGTNFHEEVPSKLEIQYKKKGHVFFI